MVKRRRSKRIWYVLFGVFVAVFLFTFLAQSFKKTEEDVDAASLANFDPGNIISDYQMSNYKSMTEAQIQSFLKNKGNCNDTRTYLAKQYSNYKYHIKNGHFVCLADETFGDGTAYGDSAPKGQSAARIIWQAAQDYKINPQVLIVLIQKEQGLVTDSWPNERQFRVATGYGCPDTAPCSAEYYGFKNQIRKAAAMFRTVLDGGWTNYPVGKNYIQYNPNASCGGSWVTIKNRATSSLYRYTPYQPNAGALAAGYGTAYCGAYGNRNFYLYFQDWFGKITQEQKNIRIPDGVYYIKSAAFETKVMDAYNAGVVNGTNIHLYNKNNSGAQQWNITYNSSTDDYIITNVISKKAVDVYNASTESGANVHLYELNKSCAQRWKIFDVGDGNVKFISTCSTNVLQVSKEGSGGGGTNINIGIDNGTNDQKWKLDPIGEIMEGSYYITSSINKNKAIDIAGGVNAAANGTNIHLFDKNNTAAQRWFFSKTKDGYYTIKNLQTNKYIDVKSASVTNGTNIQLWEANNSCAKKWRALKNGDYYTFISACSFKVLDLYGAYTSNGTNIQIYDANNSQAQKWALTSIPIIKDGEYTIVSGVSEGTDMVLDLKGNSNKIGANIQIYESNSSSAQRWTISYDKNLDYYKIINTNANKSVDVESGSKLSGANVQLWDNNATCAQKWVITKETDYYYIYSSCSDLALDVYGAYNRNSTNVHLYKANNSRAQRWYLKSYDK